MSMPSGSLVEFTPCNLKRRSRCRFAVDSADCNIQDNQKSQDLGRGSDLFARTRGLSEILAHATLLQVCGSAGATAGLPPRGIQRRLIRSAKLWKTGRCRCVDDARAAGRRSEYASAVEPLRQKRS